MKRHNNSLTVRIFLMTSALIVFACAITYGAIAYLTPITYTSILEEELRQKSLSLIETLKKVTPNESKALLDSFVRDTGAELSLWDEAGNSLYVMPTVSTETTSTSGNADGAMQVEADTAHVLSSAGMSSDAVVSQPVVGENASPTEDPMNVYDNTAAVAESAPGSEYVFSFSDGTNASMSVTGGAREVNQTVEALGRLLPFLIVVVLLISLAGAFFYARFITRPIVSISSIAQRIATLDFKARWAKHRGDEIGVLGDSLNLLSDNLSGALLQLKNANQALTWDIDRERELDQQRLAFFSAVSHELKTPVTILKGQLSGMLAQVGIYQDREKYLARALEVTGRMEGLVKEILTVSRIESGSFSLKPKPVDLSALMKKQLDLDSELLEQKNLTVEAHLRETTVQGNDQLLSKVLDSVLLNAMLYSPSGASVFIEVGDHEFSIENTGASIPEESISQLFTPFYRVEQSRNRKSGGSGLGLYLVKTILDRHNALCKIENTAHGVRFSAQFPQA